jgi:peptidoglycan/xylan/chitin deacetylase (PgdA/CDA1 family)
MLRTDKSNMSKMMTNNRTELSRSLQRRKEPPVPPPQIPAMVTLSYDDGHISNYTYAFPLHQQYNLVGTFNPHTSVIGGSIRMSPAQILECHNWGIEICSHSHTHTRMTEQTDDDLHFECTESKRIISEITGEEVKSIAIPYSFYDTRVRNIMAQHFDSARVFSDRQNDIPPADRHWLRSAIATKNTTTFGQVKQVLDQAVAGRKWCFIMLHGINPNVGSLSTYEITPTLLEEIMVYIKSFDETQLIAVTQQQGMEISDNLN